ncbi:FLYWCH-type zinc finger-containing protein 1-like [Aedes albopictus]|uniref:FLYWCH-type domain-containing protein n=1 Tax=Aedes albopictus TaxID=7160 RepID=A0ABM2A4G2_AEDAL
MNLVLHLTNQFVTAKFGYTQRGHVMLMYNGYGFIKDRQTAKTCNWKCSLFRRMKCRGRAITKIADDPPSFRAAQFGYTQRGKMMLLYDGFAYIKDRDARNSCNWKCSLAGKRKCRARAVTKMAIGRQMMKITNPNHNHDRKAYRFDTNYSLMHTLEKLDAATKCFCMKITATCGKSRSKVQPTGSAPDDMHGFSQRAHYEFTSRGTQCLVYDGYFYSKNKTNEGGVRVNWKCRYYQRFKCKARALTKTINGCDYVKVSSTEHTHMQEMYCKDLRRKRRGADKTADLEMAQFGSTQRGRPLLVHQDYTYIRNGEFGGTINWRCSAYRRLKCKAKAITVKHNGVEFVKLSYALHSHGPKTGSDQQWKHESETVDFLRCEEDEEAMINTTPECNIIYVLSKRGTKHLFFDGNTYTPNERPYPGQRSRTWKCTLYYRLKCRARIVTSEANGLPKLRVVVAEHTHEKLFPHLSEKFRSLF